MPGVEILAIAAALTTLPASGAPSPARPAMPWVAILHAQCAAGRAPIAHRIAARIGAALAWDLADLPRHQLGATRPWYGTSSDFAATVVPAGGDGGAINACIAHWNTVYPPYALTSLGGVDRPIRQENDPSEEPSCPGN